VFATQLPYLKLFTGNTDATVGELILPSPGTTLPHPVLTPASLQVDPEIRQLLAAGKPLVLVYHTHTQEAYLGPDFERRGLTYDDAFTLDQRRNMIRVGEEFARVLSQQYGIPVLHVRQYFDLPPDRQGVTKIGAYLRSLAVVEPLVRQNPQLRVVIDFHRDAFPESVPVSTAVAQLPGQGNAARIMFVVGQGVAGRLEQPYAPFNLALARRLNQWLETYYPGLSRGVLKDHNRYNQHLSPGALLIEVGEVHNTLEQALTSARILAHAVAQEILAGKVPATAEVRPTGAGTR